MDLQDRRPRKGRFRSTQLQRAGTTASPTLSKREVTPLCLRVLSARAKSQIRTLAMAIDLQSLRGGASQPASPVRLPRQASPLPHDSTAAMVSVWLFADSRTQDRPRWWSAL